MIVGFLQGAAEKMPWILSILAIMGTCRVVLKPLFAFLHTAADATETDKDNKALEKIEGSKIYKGFAFVLDWLFSWKLIK